ncbi:tellurite resistance TerB family protein [Siphonobacter sp. SORGH_AS_1065]|uniref:tellurite resistance TerB family protein n=1 Tax=Siphonobacter sp. SORGH_AS_1065 TaxID=3041795 RepID=UPI002789E0E1|nr:tellurite resistance TerB family protein [Siphonobacter sp. SORGH_AS_1065]MDQ1089441.1 tellurite resistance protein [Siphonobacter sp. SORGH_AS_1065]
MGFFDSLFKAQPVQITINDEREAFVSILYACACADGYLSDDEIDELASFLSTKDKFLRTSNAMPYIHKARDNFKTLGGAKGLVEVAAKSISADLRETTLFYAVDIILADGVVDPEEAKVLDFLKDALSVSEAQAQKITEVALLKNKIR